jgi:hypothetical protein
MQGISEITVKAHRGNVMRKMKADSFAHVVKMASRLRVDHKCRLDRQFPSPIPIDYSASSFYRGCPAADHTFVTASERLLQKYGSRSRRPYRSTRRASSSERFSSMQVWPQKAKNLFGQPNASSRRAVFPRNSMSAVDSRRRHRRTARRRGQAWAGGSPEQATHTPQLSLFRSIRVRKKAPWLGMT